MPRGTRTSDKHLAALQQRIAAGDYSVNAGSVATSIVRKLRDINRARRLLAESGDDQSPGPAEENRRPPRS